MQCRRCASGGQDVSSASLSQSKVGQRLGSQLDQRLQTTAVKVLYIRIVKTVQHSTDEEAYCWPRLLLCANGRGRRRRGC